MEYVLKDNTLKKEAYVAQSDHVYLCTVDYDKLESVAEQFDISQKFTTECSRSGSSKFESHDGFDFFSLNIPDDFEQQLSSQRVCIYFTSNLLLFVCNENKVIDDMIHELEEEGLKNITLGKVIHLFLDKLTFDDAPFLEDIEQEISQLEETLFVSSKSNMIEDIIMLRKKLLNLKRYYEQLLEIAEQIQQNENGLLDNKSLRYFKMISNRVDRLYHGVLNLRDYVTQVREAYQAQMDINLNSIMKIFAVVTSIFLPLTLLAGWYGMNLKMPEYSWDFGYLFVIGIGVVITIVIILFFKKHKWF